jgi:preprotein translocase subunit SecA
MSIFSSIFGDANEKFVKSLQPKVEKINSLEKEFEALSDEQLKAKTAEFKERLAKGETLDNLLAEAFAAVREAGKRQLKQRHFDVQLMGGMALHQGRITQMQTGEGKTLTATLAAYLNALEGKGVHIVTVNDYLAKRDTIWMGQVYAALGLTTGCIVNESGYVYDASYKNAEEDKERDMVGGFKIVQEFLRPVARKEAYSADITHGTNNEFGFDYLRDNMVVDASQETQRGFNFAIVDEVDSILIDEARVPLIISGESQDSTEKYQQFAKVVARLEKEIDYTLDEKMKAASFTDEGQNKVVKELGTDPWLENDIIVTHQLESALKAKSMFQRDKDYMVKNGEVIIIDEFTGRVLPGRRWSGGLHQAVEAKEGVRIQPESTTMATVTFQNYFRMYKKLSGMTGTALTSAEEFDKVYSLEVVAIPPHRGIARNDLADKIFKSEAGKFTALVREIEELHAKGQPILVGTRSVEKNEYVSKLLDMKGVKHQMLNAKNHEREGEIIAQAGKAGAVTIATNMAGRGVDILLGGNPTTKEEAEKVRALGGLHVIGTERHEARRIDDQLRGRAGRQGDPGTSQFFVSVDDDVMRIFGGDRVKNIMNTFKIADDEPIQAKMISGAIESAQEKIEGFNFDARKHLLEYDDVLNKHREIIYKKRREFLTSQDLKPTMLEILEKEGIEKPASAEGSGWAKEKLEEREKEIGEAQFQQFMKVISLKVIDNLWMEHLSYMDHVRDSVRLRAYGGRDPLVEYKGEGHRAFSQLLAALDHAIAESVLKANVTFAQQQPQQNVFIMPRQNTVSASGVVEEISRNDPCPCGSGKKWKKCGELNTEEHQRLMAEKNT